MSRCRTGPQISLSRWKDSPPRYLHQECGHCLKTQRGRCKGSLNWSWHGTESGTGTSQESGADYRPAFRGSIYLPKRARVFALRLSVGCDLRRLRLWLWRIIEMSTEDKPTLGLVLIRFQVCVTKQDHWYDPRWVFETRWIPQRVWASWRIGQRASRVAVRQTGREAFYRDWYGRRWCQQAVWRDE